MNAAIIPPRLWLDVYATSHPNNYAALAPHLHPAQWCNVIVASDCADLEHLAIAALVAMECGHGKALRVVSSGGGRLTLAVNHVAEIARVAGFKMRALRADGGMELVFRADRQAVAA